MSNTKKSIQDLFNENEKISVLIPSFEFEDSEHFNFLFGLNTENHNHVICSDIEILI